VLAAAVGIYLPLELMTPIFIGGLLAHFAQRSLGAGASTADSERANRKGILFASGMITGEALTGIIIAIPIVASGRADVLALPASMQFGGLLGLAIVAVLAFGLYRAATRRE